jgi:hypothetical protein
MVKFKTRFFSFIGKEISKYAIKDGYDYLRGALVSEVVLSRLDKNGNTLPPLKLRTELARIERKLLIESGEKVKFIGPMDGNKAAKVFEEEMYFYKRTRNPNSIFKRLSNLIK